MVEEKERVTLEKIFEKALDKTVHKAPVKDFFRSPMLVRFLQYEAFTVAVTEILVLTTTVHPVLILFGMTLISAILAGLGEWRWR